MLKISLIGVFSFLLFSDNLQAQTDFAPGQIMFTGYNSDDPDGFSFVILSDVIAGTQIYITDRGWSSTTGFRDDDNGEGTIRFEFTAAHPCGSSFVFVDVGGTNDWLALDEYGVTTGIVTILTSTTESPAQDPDGIEFNVGGFPFPDGDQLFIYQLPEPNPGNQTGFVTGIHMNGGAWNAGNGDDYSSQKPTGLADNQVVRFNTEVDNAKYDCSPNIGSAATLQAAITNDNGMGGLIADASNNWFESNTYISLEPVCHFCCGTIPPVAAPILDGPTAVNTNQVFTINITGTLGSGASWELYTAGCGVGAPLQTTMSSSFTITAPATEGVVIYLIRSSEDGDCEAICAIWEVGVCINVNNMNTCTNCAADPLVCGDCFLPPVAINPDLDSGCYAIKLIFVLDESGSIGSDETNVRDGVLAFLNSLNGQDLEIALIEFSSLARVVNDYTPINLTYIMNVENYFNDIPFPGSGHTYIPGGGTNWHDAMIKVDAMASADMVMFFTDGVPTGWTNNGATDFCGNGATTQTPEIVNPVKIANKIKGENTHMFMLGVGSGIDAGNLQLMSGPEEYDSDVNTIGSSDYSIGNFIDLAEDLEEFVSELCNTPLELDKQVFGAVCNGTQQFMFIIHNPGEESAATVIQVTDTFPSGYTNVTYNGPPGIKLCIGDECTQQGQPQPDNGFIWTTNSLPPGSSDTLILSVDVLPAGSYTNIGWAQGSNTDLVSDTVTSPNFVDDLDPTITCPDDVAVLCSESTLPASTGFATAVDPDGSSPEVIYSDVIIPGPCTDEFTINRTWTATDGCFNTDNCVQEIIVNDTLPIITSCAVVRNISGCSTASITGPVFSSTSMASSEAVFENATNQGVAFDSCGIDEVHYIDVASGTCPIIVTRTWTVTDVCGNTATCAQTINVNDAAGPSISVCAIPRMIEGCGTAAITDPVFSTSTTTSSETVFENATNQGAASDNCAITTVTYKDVSAGTCPIAVTRTWTITDACGNSTTCNQMITVDDNVLPSVTTCAVTRNIEGCSTAAITGPAFSTVSATSSETVFENATNQGVTSDGCGVTSVTYIDVATGTCPIVVTRTWTISDACANTATCVQTINVDDNVNPSITTCAVTRNIEGCSTAAITGPAFSTVLASSSEGVFENGTNQGVSSDVCGISTVQYIDVASGSCPTVVIRTWTLTDACGNSSTCNQTINLDDTAGPSITTCPILRVIEGCNTDVITGPVFSTMTAASSEAVFEDATNQGSTSDLCGIVTVEYIDVASGTCPIVVTRTWTLTDVCGNSSTCNQTIQVDDTTSPPVSACAIARVIEGCSNSAITDPVFSTVSATSSEAVFENATNQGSVSDVCGVITVAYIDVSTGTCPIVVTRTWTITDACGNTSTCNQSIQVDDTAVPSITTCAVTRNIEGCSTAAITGPAFSTVSATSSETVFENATNQGVTSDVCGVTTVTYIDVASGTCPFVVTRTWTISDACANTATCVQTINVDDSINPSITTCAMTRNIEGCSPGAITGPAFSTVLASSTETVFENGTNQGVSTDACGITTVQYIDVASGSCPIVVTRTWTLTDACGNSSTCNQTINVDDSAGPVISTCAVLRTIEGCNTSAITGPVFSTVLAASSETVFENATNQGASSDVCGIATVHYIDVATGACPIVVTRTWTLTDVCGNSSTCNQTIQVDDTVSPAISTCAIPRVIEGCNNSAITNPNFSTISATSSEAVFENATNQGSVSDVCGAITVTYIDVSTGTCPRVVTRTWSITDACGNTSTCNQSIQVDDTVAPSIAACAVTRNFQGCGTSAITGPPFSTVSATSSEAAFENGNNQGSASDICGITTVTYIDVVTGTCPRVVTRTWTLSDACGNSSTCNQTINVDDTVNPTITTCSVLRNIEGCSTSAITGPAYSAISATSSETVFENGTNQGDISDVCGITSVTYIDVASGTCPIVVTRTWTISDACGNSNTCAQTIQVDDTASPSITTCAVTRIIEGCDSSAITGPAYSAVSTASTEAVFENATNQGSTADGCGIAAVSYIDIATGSCPLVVTRTWTISDACGNATTCNQTIQVDDTTVPTITCPPNVTIECTASTDPMDTGGETASDNCGASLVVTYDDVIVVSPTCPVEYEITRTWTVTDICGNSNTCAQVITIEDSTPPVITCPVNVTIECIDNTLPANTGLATAADNCDTSPEMTYADVTLEVPGTNGYLIERTWTSTDTCGNDATCLQTISVVNPLLPDILGLAFDTICSGGIIEFEAVDQGINPTSYNWTFGSGSAPAMASGIGPHNIQYTYNGTNGTTGAWVVLTLGTPGCISVSDTVSNIHVNAIPNATISSPTGNPCVLQDKTFQAVAPEMPGFTYAWNFGAGASIPTANTYGPHVVEYFTGGSKTVQLIVFSNEEGASCGDTATLVFVVNVCPGNITGLVLKSDDTPISAVNVRLYADQNLDGVQDNNTAIRSVFTTASGTYAMAAVTPGHYVIVQVQPAGYESLYDEDTSEDFDAVPNTNTNDNIIPVTVEPSELDADNKFVEIDQPGIITGYVFEDFDNNQQPAPVEGLPGVTIELHTDVNLDGKADAGGFVTSTITNSSGFYTFPSVLVGSYVIVELQPDDFTSVKDIDVSNDGDAVPNTNMLNDTIPCTIFNGELDAGNYFIESSVCSRLVTSTQDDIPGSLRYMLECAEAGDTIDFHPILANQTLLLTSGRLVFDKDIHIISTVTPRISIQSNVSGAFKIEAGNFVEMKNLNIASGLSGFSGAAFDIFGHLMLWDVQVSKNPLLPGTEYLIFNGSSGEMTAKGDVQIETE